MKDRSNTRRRDKGQGVMAEEEESKLKLNKQADARGARVPAA